MPCVASGQMKGPYLYIYRCLAHPGGGEHDGYRHVQILLCMDILKDEGVSKINRYNYFGYMQCLLKACWRDFNVLVHVLNCFDVAHNFVLCSCAWRMTVVDEGRWWEMHYPYGECILSPTDFDVGSECWDSVCTHIGWRCLWVKVSEVLPN